MKIAILGSAPSSLSLAPYDDPAWTIWACSPGAAANIKRSDAFFELHRWGQDWLTKEYRDFLAKHPKVFMVEPVSDVPGSVAYPKQDMLREFGPYFFTSTPAWMLALAITLKPEEIGIWGIDMATDSEYALQKPGCLHFVALAQAKGIRIGVPVESDLLRPPALYGFSEGSPMMAKLLARKAELEKRLAYSNESIDGHTKQAYFLKGALDDLSYIIQTWTE